MSTKIAPTSQNSAKILELLNKIKELKNEIEHGKEITFEFEFEIEIVAEILEILNKIEIEIENKKEDSIEIKIVKDSTHFEIVELLSRIKIERQKNEIVVKFLEIANEIGKIKIENEMENDIKNTLRPLIDGGGQEKMLRSGTLSPALCVGLGEACKDLKKNRSQYFEHYKKLKSYILSELIKSKIDFVINGSVEKRSPVNLNICITGKIAEQLFTFFPHIALSTGAACTSGTIERSHVLSALKISDEQIDGSFRISFGRQSSKEDIKELLESLNKAS